MIITMKIIDIHNHMMPYVDDGAREIDTTKKMIEECSIQGIGSVFLTPHVNSSVSKANRETHIKMFLKIKEIANKVKLNVYLGAEIFISDKIPNLDFKKFVMGDSNALLVEFSTYYSSPIIDICHDLIKKGFKVIVAHIERYNYLELDDLYELKNMGVYIQVNASSVLKNMIFKKNKSLLYIKRGLVDFIASDSHNITNRPQNLKIAYKKIEKSISKKVAKELFFENQSKILIKS